MTSPMFPTRTSRWKASNRFNSAHEDASFTKESNSNNGLAFLDILVVRKPNGSAQRKVYQEDAWNGQYTYFASVYLSSINRTWSFAQGGRARKVCIQILSMMDCDFYWRVSSKMDITEGFSEYTRSKIKATKNANSGKEDPSLIAPI